MAASRIVKINYILTKEMLANSPEQGYSRLLISCQTQKEAQRLQDIFANLKPYGMECSVLDKKQLTEFKQEGDFALNILVNVKLQEEHNPGYSINQTLKLIFDQLQKDGVSPSVDEQFIRNLTEGFKFKKAVAAKVLPIFGIESEEKIMKATPLDFSHLIKSCNKNPDVLPVMDQFGEFDDCEKIVGQLANLKGQGKRVVANFSSTTQMMVSPVAGSSSSAVEKKEDDSAAVNVIKKNIADLRESKIADFLQQKNWGNIVEMLAESPDFKKLGLTKVYEVLKTMCQENQQTSALKENSKGGLIPNQSSSSDPVENLEKSILLSIKSKSMPELLSAEWNNYKNGANEEAKISSLRRMQEFCVGRTDPERKQLGGLLQDLVQILETKYLAQFTKRPGF